MRTSKKSVDCVMPSSLYSEIFKLFKNPCLLVNNDNPVFTIVDVNQAFLRATGTEEKYLLGKGLFEAFPHNPADNNADGPANLHASLNRVLSTGQPHKMAIQKYDIPIIGTDRFEERYWDPENIPVLDANNNVVLIMYTALDVTGQVNAMNEKMQTEELYNQLFHLIPLPLWIYDVPSMKIIDVNNCAISNYGYSKEEYLNMTIGQLHVPEDDPYLRFVLLKNMEIDDIPDYSCRHIKKNREILSVEVHSMKIKFRGRDAIIKIAFDITQLIDYIGIIEQQNEKLKEIAWAQSHIYRSPVARLMGLVSLLTNGKVNNGERHKIYDGITETAKELDALIRDISETSKEV